MLPRAIDVHGHVQFEAFAQDWKDVVDRTLASDTWIVIPSTQLATSQRAIDIAQKFSEGVYAAVGFHPTHVKGPRGNVYRESDFAVLLSDSKVVAVGECGLDYFRMDQSRREEWIPLQQDVLRSHFRLATAHNLPLIIHCRDAYDDLIALLRQEIQHGNIPKRGLIHCYLSDWDHAQQFLELGFSLSFTGIITFTKDEKLLDVVRNIPMNRFCIETDAPYLTPVPHRGKRNEPLYVEFIAQKVAELKGISRDEVLAATVANARAMFGI